MRAWFGELWLLMRRRPAEVAALALALVTCGYVIGGPLIAARYPPLMDLPFHAANAAIFEGYLDPTLHFREQFSLQPFAVPYITMYLVAAGCMLFMSALSAIKVATFVMLLMLPLGLAVLFAGMRKSPLLGLSGAGFAWCGLTHWGFIHFVAAIGLFAMALGLALMLLDEPRRRTQLWLALTLVALFFTHPFRFPFAVAACVGVGIALFPATRRMRPLLVPLLGPVALFVAWWLTRPRALIGALHLDVDETRLGQIGDYLYASLTDPAEAHAAMRALYIGVGLFALLAIAFVTDRRLPSMAARERRWFVGSHVVVLSSVLVFGWMYLSLPMEVGEWWYVYPREITAASFVLLALLPDLPKAPLAKLACTALIALALWPLGSVMSDAGRKFETDDFDAIVTHIPAAPRLMYLVIDHEGHASRRPLFLHLPAYVQAARGGWLSFHFAVWGASPVVYRPRDEPGAIVPPPVPRRWEWTPQKFRVLEHGQFFDWFLIRRRRDPADLLRDDASLVPVAHEGMWWLYRRAPS